MTTTPTNPYPDIPLPPETYALADWDETDGDYRIFSAYSQLVSGIDAMVSANAVQLPDGSINIAADADPPAVFVDKLEDGVATTCLTITAEGARKLAQALIEAAEQIDGWVAR